MAPNSLFAVLLRSPWWISLTVALVFGLASRALLPAEFWQFGAMGGVPFLVIAAMAARRQWRTPGARRVEQVAVAVRGMAWREFSRLLEDAFVRDGARVQPSNSPAADFVVVRGGRTALVCARRWKAAHHGVEALQALHAARQEQDAGEAIYIALGALSDNARKLCASGAVRHLSDTELAQLLRHLDLPASTTNPKH